MNPVMKFLDRLRLMRFFFQLVADPTRTDKIFGMLPIFVRSADPKQLADFEASLLSHDGFRRQWEERFVPAQPSKGQLASYPEGTFGHALHEHLEKYGLDLEFYPEMPLERPVDYLSIRMSQDHDFVHALPKNLDPAGAAPLLCAGITTYSPLRHWKVGPGMTVGVVGIGG
ncbi:MAG: hypothetical protein V4760_03875, partial [Bdellovibrionota bacterium]